MIPKSTSKLSPGDYCLLPRADGSSVAFAYLASVPNSRSTFYGALLSPPLQAGQQVLPASLRIVYKGMVHIGCYAKNDTPIVGNAAGAVGHANIEAAVYSCTDMSVGAVHGVIGHLALLKRAEGVGA